MILLWRANCRIELALIAHRFPREEYGAITSRAEAEILRLSMIFALADRNVEISIDHLKAALAVWNYARNSVRYLFSKELKDANVIKAFKAIRAAGAEGVSRQVLLADVFQRNISADQLTKCLSILKEGKEGGYAFKELRKTAGRPAEIWKSTFRVDLPRMLSWGVIVRRSFI